MANIAAYVQPGLARMLLSDDVGAQEGTEKSRNYAQLKRNPWPRPYLICSFLAFRDVWLKWPARFDDNEISPGLKLR